MSCTACDKRLKEGFISKRFETRRLRKRTFGKEQRTGQICDHSFRAEAEAREE